MYKKKISTADIDKRAHDVHGLFSKKQEATSIASPIGLHVLFSMLDELKPTHVLEIGGGIGTLSYAVLAYSNATLDVFERHPVCIEALKKNLAPYNGRFTILTDYVNFTLPRKGYDILIIDGGNLSVVRDVIKKTDRIKRILIEGGRGEQAKQARKMLRQAYLYRPMRYKHTEREYKGAHQMILTSNNNPLVRYVLYWVWEFIIFREIKMYIKHKLSRIFAFFSRTHKKRLHGGRQ